MFDVNPNPYGGEGAIDKGDMFKDAEYFRLTASQARSRYEEIKSVVDRDKNMV